MKTKNARRIIRILFPASKHYNATIVYSGIVCQISIEAPDEFRARVELDRIADGGYITFFEEA